MRVLEDGVFVVFALLGVLEEGALAPLGCFATFVALGDLEVLGDFEPPFLPFLAPPTLVSVGVMEGSTEGPVEGAMLVVGVKLGFAEGWADGVMDGRLLGLEDGLLEGAVDGWSLGAIEGPHVAGGKFT